MRFTFILKPDHNNTNLNSTLNVLTEFKVEVNKYSYEYPV